jgi:hypothetical protein
MIVTRNVQCQCDHHVFAVGARRSSNPLAMKSQTKVIAGEISRE